MGNSASKTKTLNSLKSVNKTKTPSPTSSSTSNFDQNFGREIMKNIKLKESPVDSLKQESSTANNLRKRMELDQQTEGKVSWEEFSLIFQENNSVKLDKSKIDELKKYFSLPDRSNDK